MEKDIFLKVSYSYNSNWCSDVVKLNLRYLSFEEIKNRIEKTLKKECGDNAISCVSVSLYSMLEI